MQRILTWVLAALIGLLPIESVAQSRYEAATEGGSPPAPAKKKKKKKKPPKEVDEQQAEADEWQAEAEASQGARRRKKHEPKVIDVTPPATGDAATPAPQPDPPAAAAAAPPAADDDDDFEDNPSKWAEVVSQRVPPRRYSYVLGAIAGATGLVFAYQSQGEAKRAETITSALESQRAVQNAQASAALANIFYAVAAAAVVLGLVLEFLPEPIADKANLTFHF